MKTPITKFAFLALVIGLFLIFNRPTKAQSALDGFDPNANNTVFSIAMQSDGKVIVGGDFTTLSPNGGAAVTRNRIARLNADGTLDSTFDPNANGTVLLIAVQSDGKILIVGNFFALSPNGGAAVTRNRIARLNADGTLDSTFDPNANNSVYSIATQSDGKILIGGFFTTLSPNGGAAVTRNRIARLNADGTLDTSFDPNANNEVRSIVVQSDGKVIVGGDFTTLSPNGGAAVARNRIARLNADGTLDTSFDPNANSIVFSIVVQSDGKIIIGGNFTTLSPNGGAATIRNYIARLNADGTLDSTFNPNANSEVRSIAVQSDGKVIIGGDFTLLSPNGGAAVSRNSIARLNADGTLDTSFNPNANSRVSPIVVQSDGKILIGGFFTTINGTTRNRIARLERDGSLDQTLNLGNSVLIFAIAIQPDGKIIVGGAISNILGTPRNRLARLNADGTLDTSFDPNVTGGDVYSVAIQSDGKILIGGNFNGVGGQTRNCIARLNADGTLDTNFDPNANGYIGSIVIQPDGKILVGGGFNGVNSIGGQTRNYIARLNSDGTVDSFDPNANYVVRSISLMPDGKILIGGFFTNIGGQTRNHLARLNPDGTADSFDPNPNGSFVEAIAMQSDGKILVGGSFSIIGGQPRSDLARLNADGTADSFNPIAGSSVDSIAIQSDGKILVGGQFNSIGGQTRNYIARLNSDGTVDSFNPNANLQVVSITLQPDGKILAGGFFSNIGGQSRGGFARLSNDTAAISTLTVNKTSVALTRDGSAPQFSRVVFEQSIDNGATYTALGTATNNGSLFAGNKTSEIIFAPDAPTASGYTLTGLNLPTGQNILIRARGIYRSGSQNGSETIEDKVQNAFLLAPTAAAVSISGRVTTPLEFGMTSARVTLTDMQGNSRTVLTGKFGSYRFTGVMPGETYILTVASRRYAFAPQVITVTEDITEVNFTAQ